MILNNIVIKNLNLLIILKKFNNRIYNINHIM